MPRFFGLAAALATAVFLAGCETIGGGGQHAIYSAPLNGEFNETGQFAAELILVVDDDGKTFNGVLQRFRFSRNGFDRPAGRVPVSGTITASPEGDAVLAGSGEGTLTQGRQEYLVEFEFEGTYADRGRERISAWYFGGGDFNRSGQYVDWPKLRGEFTANIICRSSPLNPNGCQIPQALLR
ncbi:hypothetical protein [Sinisalibacter aestuarii]|uniref:Lipoprotein n=1 Tax=Sinisalibacter aestuarii TaxID=2949426 RepID=A0ABQ5LTZ4_9RHOB|nr:hypothetical protein [Sinisalibacter aestuarii]GKY88459.1 hypothetical protein STA1M1_23280 [Sinisalibacter aestuarii]